MDDALSLADILAVLRRRFWVVFVVVLLAVALVAVLSYVVLPPIYEASTSLIVNERSSIAQGTSGVDYGQIQTNRSLAVTYAKIITSRAVLQDTIDTLRLPETVKQLTRMTAVHVEGDTEIIAVSVKDKDAIRAASIANTMANSFITQLPALVNRVENVSVIDRAVPVTDQISPRPLLNIAVTFIAALVLGLVLAFLVDDFDDRVKTPDDVKKNFRLRVLAVIPDTNARGVGSGSTVKSDGYGNGGYKGSRSPVAEAFRVLRTNLQFAAVDKELKVIMVTMRPNDARAPSCSTLHRSSRRRARDHCSRCDLLTDPASPFRLPQHVPLHSSWAMSISPCSRAEGIPQPLGHHHRPHTAQQLRASGSVRMKHLMTR